MFLARYRWWVPVALAVGLRLAVGGAAWSARGPDAFRANDSSSYLDAAASLARGAGFRDEAGRPELFRVPGYPLLVAATTAAGAPVAGTLALHLLLSAVLVWRVAALAHRTTGREDLAMGAGCAMAVEPTSLLWSLKVMPDTLFALAVLTFVETAIGYRAAPSLRRAAVAGAALAAAAYVKPAGYPLAVALSAGALVAAAVPRLRPYRGQAVAAVVVLAFLLGAWHVRNWRVAGYPGFATQLDLALYVSAGGAALARRDGVPFNEVRARLLEGVRAAATAPAADVGGVHARARRVGWTLVATAPLGALSAHLAGTVRTLVDPGAVEYFRLFGAYPEDGGLLGVAVDRGLGEALRAMAARTPAVAVASIGAALVTLPYLVVALVAAWWLPPAMRSTYLVAALVALGLGLVSGGPPGSSRLRVPMVPLLVVMATCGAAGAATAARRTSRPAGS